LLVAPPVVSDEEVELRVGALLQAGVLAASVLVALGGVVYLIKYGATAPHHETFTGEPDDLKSIGGIVKAAASLRGRGVIQLGLLVLLATPVARVAFSLYTFIRQRDRTYVLMTAFVLLLLLGSLFQVWAL
jgi:uncharacterized membrane protein